MKKNTPPYLVLQLEADMNENDDVHFLNRVTDEGKAQFRSLFVALPFTRMEAMASHFPDSGIHFGATQLNDCSKGSFTAPIAAQMVKTAGGQFVLVGTRKEKASLKGSVQDKLSRAFDNGLKVIFCLDGEEDLAKQCALLDPHSPFFEDSHPLVIYQPQLTALKNYLPSKDELEALYEKVKGAVNSAWKEKAEKVSLLVHLPSDLSGFSSLLEGSHFDGMFCIKSGVYPHDLQEELAGLLKINALDG